tara:strand:- start:17427 stop:18359 length:933 start_codon:yes stop_codon:yes gene_type:complete
MKHVILIDPLKKLILKKDSTLLFSKSLVDSKNDVFFLFREDFCISNIDSYIDVSVPTFETGSSSEITCVKLDQTKVKVTSDVCFHMRLEPPFDTNYLRVLWMLKFIQSKGARVINDPSGIMNFQEKIFPMEAQKTTPTAVIRSFEQFKVFAQNLPKEREFILKPLDLFQGLGVTKVDISKFSDIEFVKLSNDFGGLLIVQPYLKKIEHGEIRSTFYAGQEIGSILKTPPKGSFLANIAQGASYEKINLKPNVRDECKRAAKFLNEKGVPWVAFDLLDGKISEANTTCPGLIYETSVAHGENLADKIVELI